MNRSLLAVFAVLIVTVAYSDAYCSYHPFKFRQSGPFGKVNFDDYWCWLDLDCSIKEDGPYAGNYICDGQRAPTFYECEGACGT
ncbi:hypothetical protein Bhyg_03672 [Pseudolycoriella hygida]|uniref:Uncharacterized protein n=1 Tax=Pseudolycoriella hygida TaxID=35572 RepID=A0A9Q0S7Q3_9DIPT|nr:hypothetical protein Bhyg_03672 [Pseudolycoriella hygida]